MTPSRLRQGDLKRGREQSGGATGDYLHDWQARICCCAWLVAVRAVNSGLCGPCSMNACVWSPRIHPPRLPFAACSRAAASCMTPWVRVPSWVRVDTVQLVLGFKGAHVVYGWCKHVRLLAERVACVALPRFQPYAPAPHNTTTPAGYGPCFTARFDELFTAACAGLGGATAGGGSSDTCYCASGPHLSRRLNAVCWSGLQFVFAEGCNYGGTDNDKVNLSLHLLRAYTVNIYCAYRYLWESGILRHASLLVRPMMRAGTAGKTASHIPWHQQGLGLLSAMPKYHVILIVACETVQQSSAASDWRLCLRGLA